MAQSGLPWQWCPDPGQLLVSSALFIVEIMQAFPKYHVSVLGDTEA